LGQPLALSSWADLKVSARTGSPSTPRAQDSQLIPRNWSPGVLGLVTDGALPRSVFFSLRVHVVQATGPASSLSLSIFPGCGQRLVLRSSVLLFVNTAASIWFAYNFLKAQALLFSACSVPLFTSFVFFTAVSTVCHGCCSNELIFPDLLRVLAGEVILESPDQNTQRFLI
jgi:hypothetical protein